MTDWTEKKCEPCKPGTPPMTADEVQVELQHLEGWQLESGALQRTFSFKNYYQTTAFVNAAAWIAHREDHHPDICFGYKECTIRYATHSVGGISPNDFICAAKTNVLIA